MKRFSIKSSQNIENTLRKIGKLCDEEFEIGGVALLLGAMDNPNKKIEYFLDHLIQIASDVSDTIVKTKKATLDNRINCLKEIIVNSRGYIGDSETENQIQIPDENGNFGDLKYYPRTDDTGGCLLYTSPSPRDATLSRMASCA